MLLDYLSFAAAVGVIVESAHDLWLRTFAYDNIDSSYSHNHQSVRCEYRSRDNTSLTDRIFVTLYIPGTQCACGRAGVPSRCVT